ncbi:general secretion pathway protein GspK [bacterium]|nr:general secretion pathway protein GspK [bacterium]
MRFESGAASNAVEQVRAEAVAEAATNRAILSLFDRRKEMRWPTNGTPKEFVFDDTTNSVSVQDERGKININLASNQLLSALFKSVGLDEEEARKLADRIADWRDPDDLRRLHGAEASDYIRAGWQYSPRNRPFETTGEAARVLGMTTEVMREIEPAITVYSNTGSVDLKVAVPVVLRMMSEDHQSAAKKRTESGRSQAPSPLSMPITDAAAGGKAYTVRAVVETGTSIQIGWETVVVPTGNFREPVRTLRWQRLATEDVPEEAD